jgi:hypothetical protein
MEGRKEVGNQKLEGMQDFKVPILYTFKINQMNHDS